MRKTITFALILLLLTASFTGCGRRSNVSDDENGRITETTTHAETIRPTTEPTTTAETTYRETTHSETTEQSTVTESADDPITDPSESSIKDNGTTGESSTANGDGRSRSRTEGHAGLSGGNGRF